VLVLISASMPNHPIRRAGPSGRRLRNVRFYKPIFRMNLHVAASRTSEHSDPLLMHDTCSQHRGDDSGQTIHANLDNVATLFRDDARHRGTVIAFMGGATDAIIVCETPEEILKAAKG
jgi:hypothetical protein